MGVEKYDEMIRLVNEARGYFEEFQKGKKIAATKARKSLQQIKRVAQDCRIAIQEIKQSPPCQTQGDGGAPT